MQNEKDILLSLNGTVFKIPSGFGCLFTKKIYNKIINKHFYKIKSNVSNNVFESFIKYIIDKETPNINSDNFFEYEELSNEFDIMKQLIQFYQINIKSSTNLSLINKNQKLKAKLNSHYAKLSSKQKNYKQIIHTLFKDNQTGTYFKLSPVKEQMIKYCQEDNLQRIEILTKKMINQDGLSFILNEKERTASLYHIIKAKSDIIIPSFIKFKKKNFDVTRILENAFKNSNGVKSIQFSDDSKISLIEKSSLSCKSLKKVVLPSNLDHFSAEFFCESEQLTQISINSKNTNFLIYENTLLLGKEDIKSENYDVLLFARRDVIEVIIPSFIKRIAPYAFESCRNLKQVLFQADSQLKSIDKFAFFRSCLTSISIPSSVKRIGEHAFSNCFELKKVEFKNDSKLKSIGNNAFYLTSLENISIPPLIVRINEGTFQDCNISKVEFSSNTKLKSIGRRAFSKTLIESISIPSSLIQIEERAFSNCSNLKKIEFPENSELQIIGENAFFRTILEEITIPSSVLDLQDGFLAGIQDIVNFKIHSKSKNFFYYQNRYLLGKSDFKNDVYDVILFGSAEIETATIFPFIKEIAGFAFDNCKSLQKVDFSQNKNINLFEKHMFNYSNLKEIVIPSKIQRICKYAFALCSSLKKVVFEPNSQLKSIESYAFAWSPLEKIVIPSNVTKIYKNAFYSCYKLKEVEFLNDSKLTKIYKDALAASAIKRFFAPESLIEIEHSAFYSCEHLQYIIFSENSNLKSIGNFAFTSSSLRCISIPKSVIKLGDYAFFKCKDLEIIEITNIAKIRFFNIDLLCFDPPNNNVILMISNKHITYDRGSQVK